MNYCIMEKIIRIDNLRNLYAKGIKHCAEKLLRAKAEKGENVVYSIDGQIVKLKASDALWLYDKLKIGIQDKEFEILQNRAAKGEDMQYRLEGDQTFVIPAQLVLDLVEQLPEKSRQTK